MTAFRFGFRRTLAATILSFAGTIFAVDSACGQQVFVTQTSVGSPMGSGGGSRVTSRSIEAYSQLLGLDQDQTEIARELHQQYVTSVDEANQQRRASIKSVMEEFRETEDHTILQEKMPKMMEEADKRTKRIEAALFDDLRLLLDEEQAARWERVERLRRRETTLKSGGLSGETTDLISVTEKVLGEDTFGVEVTEALEQYEMELDRALVSKAKTLEEVREAYSGMTMTFDLSSMEETGKKTREAGLRVREVNKRHARVIESLLPEGLASEFREETKRRNFPQVYRESRVDRLLTAAQSLTDLAADQKTSVGELTTSYTRDRGAADTKWAAAIGKDDEEGGSGFSSGSMMIRIMDTGDEDESPVAKARKDRKELDERIEDRLMAILNSEQRERMPKPEENQSFGRNGTFISSDGPGMTIEVIGGPDRE